MTRIRPSRRTRGFSLVELTLVVAIMGVLGAIAFPRYTSSLTRYRVDSAARRLCADLILTRETAKQRSQAVTITFMAGTQSQYVLAGIRDPDRPALADCTVAIWKEPYLATFGSISVGGDAALTFDGFGVPDSAGAIVVRVGSLTRTVTVAANTGDILISSP